MHPTHFYWNWQKQNLCYFELIWPFESTEFFGEHYLTSMLLWKWFMFKKWGRHWWNGWTWYWIETCWYVLYCSLLQNLEFGCSCLPQSGRTYTNEPFYRTEFLHLTYLRRLPKHCLAHTHSVSCHPFLLGKDSFCTPCHNPPRKITEQKLFGFFPSELYFQGARGRSV